MWFPFLRFNYPIAGKSPFPELTWCEPAFIASSQAGETPKEPAHQPNARQTETSHRTGVDCETLYKLLNFVFY